MAVGDMGGLVRDDGLQHLGRVDAKDQAVIDVDCVVVDDKGVERAIVDHQNAHPVGVQPRSPQDRKRKLAQTMFDIGIPYQALRGTLRRH